MNYKGETTLNTWKPKKFRTQDRYNIANDILNELMNKYNDNLISVAIEGSTAKGMDRPESDLELRAVVKGRDSEW